MNSIVNSIRKVSSEVNFDATAPRCCQLHREELVSEEWDPYDWYPEVSGLHVRHETSVSDKENCICVV